jgi:hypothetical protein
LRGAPHRRIGLHVERHQHLAAEQLHRVAVAHGLQDHVLQPVEAPRDGRPAGEHAPRLGNEAHGAAMPVARKHLGGMDADRLDRPQFADLTDLHADPGEDRDHGRPDQQRESRAEGEAAVEQPFEEEAEIEHDQPEHQRGGGAHHPAPGGVAPARRLLRRERLRRLESRGQLRRRRGLCLPDRIEPRLGLGLRRHRKRSPIRKSSALSR